jgi:hypothetical protein
MEATYSSAALASTYSTTRCHIPEDYNMNIHHCENLRPEEYHLLGYDTV